MLTVLVKSEEMCFKLFLSFFQVVVFFFSFYCKNEEKLKTNLMFPLTRSKTKSLPFVPRKYIDSNVLIFF